MASPLTPDEHQRIHTAVDAVEQGTAADLDIVVTRTSDRYSLYPLVWAAYAALAAAGLAALVSPHLNGRRIILIELLVLIVLTMLFDWMPIRLKLVPERVKRAHARQLAHREFAAPHTQGGPERKRILLFVSLGERYVEILADHATYAAADREVWNATVAEFIAELTAGRIADGILGAIESCGAILRAHHPA
jgi:putative membrane protein